MSNIYITYQFKEGSQGSSQYSNSARGTVIWSLNPNRDNIFFFSPKRPNQLSGPPSLLFNGYWVWGLATHLHLVPMSRMSTATNPPPLQAFIACAGITPPYFISLKTYVHICPPLP